MEAGYLYLSGRAGRMVTVADQNVFPEEIEAFIAGLPGVRAGGGGAARGCFARGGDGGDCCRGMQAVRARFWRPVGGSLGALKAPRAVIWRADWPVLASGKVDLRRLALEAGL